MPIRVNNVHNDHPDWIVVVGDLAEGFIFIGPFYGLEWAEEWARQNVREGNWTVQTLRNQY